jgi:hypothetical protein
VLLGATITFVMLAVGDRLRDDENNDVEGEEDICEVPNDSNGTTASGSSLVPRSQPWNQCYEDRKTQYENHSTDIRGYG